ncbi:hypothetical protein [Escherichia coli]|uniref:hypothetical protein n=1 Tax=Escherichia coli TaxID=562 RepID=UPI0038B301AE
MKVINNDFLPSVNLSNDRVRLMLNRDNKALDMSLFEKLWEALCGLFRSETQSEPRAALFDFMSSQVKFASSTAKTKNWT